MKRGLIFWDRKAWPEEEFRARIERVKTAMRRDGLDAILIYGDANQSGDLAYLTHFIPYADTGIFILPIQAPPRLLTTHAYRNMVWFRTITWVEDIICTNDMGRECAEYLGASIGPGSRIGSVSTRTFPYAVSRAVEEGLGRPMTDFTGAYERIRSVKSPRELAYVGRAGDIASDVFGHLAAFLRPGVSGFDVAAEAEREARGRGAEDLFFFIHADNAAGGLSLPNADPILRTVSIEIAVEYNGYWSKLGRTVVLNGSPGAVRLGLRRFTKAYLESLNGWREGRTLRSFFESLRALWTDPVHFQVDHGLEPYWGTHALKNRNGGGAAEGPAALYLQASTTLPGGVPLLRTDTFAIKNAEPDLLTHI
jgi:Xaa-Pro aminopeptidase